MRATARSHWIVGHRFDLGWFVAPGLIAAAVGLGIHCATGLRAADSGSSDDPAGTLAIWIVGVLLVDVAHVWASLYRTYLDPGARQRHRNLLTAVPVAVFVGGLALHYVSALLFWRVLAYVAIFHFIKQHEGFVAIYGRGASETPYDRWLARVAVWSGTLAPVLWWHTHLPRRFSWFLEGDLLEGAPALLGWAALIAEASVLVVFVARRVQLAARGAPNWMVPALVLTPALCWNLGIVWTNDDRIFTVTNVFLHGIPYLALVWIAGGREAVERGLRPGRADTHGADAQTRSVGQRPALLLSVAVYYALLVLLALAEEVSWDRLVWHDHEQLFGAGMLELDRLSLAAVVALLTVPQATHYVLDRYIWRGGPANPDLGRQLGLERSDAAPGDPTATPWTRRPDVP